MTAIASEVTWGSVRTPRFQAGPGDVVDDVRLNGRYYTYVRDVGLVAGVTLSVMCVVDRPVREVWPVYKDHNLWQNSYDYYYSGVVGDLEGQTFTLGGSPTEPTSNPPYEVLRVVPEYLVVFHQPSVGQWPVNSVMPGHGIVSPGVMSFGVDEYAGQSHIAVFMEHSSVMALPDEIAAMTEDDVIGPWREMLVDGVRKWRDIFIPNLKELVYEGSLSDVRR
jgi:hypothetical protein